MVGVEVHLGDTIDIGLGHCVDLGRIRLEVVGGEVVEDQFRDPTCDAEGRLELVGEAPDEPELPTEPVRTRRRKPEPDGDPTV